MSKDDLAAVQRMYNALMAIGAIDDSLHSQMWCFARAQCIANEAMREMNSEHTKLIAKAIGIL